MCEGGDVTHHTSVQHIITWDLNGSSNSVVQPDKLSKITGCQKDQASLFEITPNWWRYHVLLDSSRRAAALGVV